MYSGCAEKTASLRLIASQSLDFPAASGIEYANGELFLFGDNAPHLLVLSPTYKPIRKIQYWPDSVSIIAKEDKPDIESAILLQRACKPVVLGVGSLSDKNRWPVYEWAVGSDSVKKTRIFPAGITFPGIKEINIEGSTLVNETMVFCNRANLTTKTNHLIFSETDGNISVKEIRLPLAGSVPGLSGLYYVKEKDLLLFTASEEATFNATEDGEIGESYLGWIRDFSTARKNDVLSASGMLQLTAFSSQFKGQKIESVCAEGVNGNSYRLHLVADNDDGKSQIFRVDLQL